MDNEAVIDNHKEPPNQVEESLVVHRFVYDLCEKGLAEMEIRNDRRELEYFFNGNTSRKDISLLCLHSNSVFHMYIHLSKLSVQVYKCIVGLYLRISYIRGHLKVE